MRRPIMPKQGILDITPYEGGESRLEAGREVIKLSSNESPWGPSEAALAAYRAAGERLALYPDGSHRALREAIAEVHGLDADRIVCGAGSDEILGLLCHAYAGPGDEVIRTGHGFAMYEIYARGAGATPVVAPERDRVVDVDAILDKVTENTRLVFIANPANPTGTMIPEKEVVRLATSLPEHVLLVLDGAYAEFVEGFDGGAALVDARDNVVMTRTFSKIHGLGALRVGWAYGPDHVIDVLNRLRSPFNVSAPALAAAAAAVRDTNRVGWLRAENARLRTWMTERLTALGIAIDPSFANFVLARFDSPATADAADQALRARGIIVRKVAGYGLPEALRITVGTEEQCRKVVAAIEDFMAGRAAAVGEGADG